MFTQPRRHRDGSHCLKCHKQTDDVELSISAKTARNINVFKYLLTKLSNNINVFVIFKWSLTLAIFETISETTQEILEN